MDAIAIFGAASRNGQAGVEAVGDWRRETLLCKVSRI